MNTNVRFKYLEKGQVIPIVVVSLFALIAMAALLIDGGMLMAHRRTAQAAADAGALAGAESLCPGRPGQGQARVAAEDYVARNQADLVSISFPQDTTIRVETSISSGSFFARIFDILGLTAGAAAEANCSPVGAANVLPVGFPCYPVDFEGNVYPDLVSDSEYCYVKYGDDTQTIQWHIDENRMVIIMDTQSATDEYCAPEGPINCTSEAEELKSILIDEANRGWLSLDGSVGASDLCSWVNPGYDGLIRRGTWLKGSPGNKNSMFTNASCLPSVEGDIFIVPIFNEWCMGNPQANCPTKFLGGDTIIPTSPIPEGFLYYRIDSFVYFKITCANSKGKTVCPYREHLIDEGIIIAGGGQNKNLNHSTLEGYFLEGQTPFAGGDGLDMGLYVVQLTK